MTISRSEEETRAAGRALAARLHPGSVVAVEGDLGAGKTAFVKGLAEGLGYRGEVTSPTFSLAQEYVGGTAPVAHIDLYRIETEAEAVRAGIEEYLGGEFVAAVEWAGKFPGLIPPGAIRVRLAVRGENEREISVG